MNIIELVHEIDCEEQLDHNQFSLLFCEIFYFTQLIEERLGLY